MNAIAISAGPAGGFGVRTMNAARPYRPNATGIERASR